MENQVCLITGANSGIGQVTARELARAGMTVLMVCRDVRKGEAARREIVAATGNGRVALLRCDLSDQEDIVQLAEDVRRQHDHLDVLLHNAGLIGEKRTLTAQGLETTLAVNHLAPFLLTHLLLPLLRRSREPRIVTVSSEAHRFARLDFNDLQSEKRYAPLVAYADSKLANILFTRSLANQLRGEGITANCLHPGGVATNFGSGFGGGLLGLAMTLARPFFISPEKGAETSIFLASSPAVKGVSGQYFDRKKPKEPSQKALSHYNAQRLWEISEQLTRTRERMTND
ncbi:MAG: SDR family oxidoreductase [Ferruginibacter sp.]|nr:SDR family oxidoreductase [Cytophagales bacterium]